MTEDGDEVDEDDDDKDEDKEEEDEEVEEEPCLGRRKPFCIAHASLQVSN